ncbi:TPA: DUF5801 repeats-in-toxin domain-containing protein, partial [Klebsiella pneumoniae]
FELVVGGTGSSGLQVTDGSSITLQSVGSGTVVGVVSSGAFSGQAAFAISIDGGGVVTVEQYLSLKHPDMSNSNDPVSLAEGALGVKVTLQDADGDKASSNVVDLSKSITFLDDGPVVGLPAQAPALGSVTVDESLSALGGAYSDGIASAT